MKYRKKLNLNIEEMIYNILFYTYSFYAVVITANLTSLLYEDYLEKKEKEAKEEIEMTDIKRC